MLNWECRGCDMKPQYQIRINAPSGSSSVALDCYADSWDEAVSTCYRMAKAEGYEPCWVGGEVLIFDDKHIHSEIIGAPHA